MERSWTIGGGFFTPTYRTHRDGQIPPPRAIFPVRTPESDATDASRDVETDVGSLRWPLSICSCHQRFPDCRDTGAKLGIAFQLVLHLFDAMKNGGVVATTQGATNIDK